MKKKKVSGHLKTLKESFEREKNMCVSLKMIKWMYIVLTVAFVISLFEIFQYDSINYLLI